MTEILPYFFVKAPFSMQKALKRTFSLNYGQNYSPIFCPQFNWRSNSKTCHDVKAGAKNNAQIYKIFVRALALTISLVFCAVSLSACSNGGSIITTTETVTIAVPYTERLFGINDEHYKEWLREQTGLHIEFEFLPEAFTEEYLRMVLSDDDSDIDAVFFSDEQRPSESVIEELGRSGLVVPLEDYIDDSTYLSLAFTQYADENLKQSITASDGRIYFMPSFDSTDTAKMFQTLWINVGWLEQLGLQLPRTTMDFAQVLRAFKENYPSAVPLIGSAESENTFAVNFLMNAFTVCAPNSYYLAVQGEEVFYPPMTEQWRLGLQYIHALFKDGLFVEQNFTYSQQQLQSLCNDPADVVGAFTSKGMSDTLFEESPELLSRYMAVTPLTGATSDGFFVTSPVAPRPGGIITNSAQDKQAVFELMDLMCSEQAFLHGHYGEPGVDYTYSAPGEISTSGEPAVITITSQDSISREMDSSGAVGPYITRAEYADFVAWKGYQINQSVYLETRAFELYSQFDGGQIPDALLFSYSTRQNEQALIEAAQYTRESMTDFITGAKDPHNDEHWAQYLQGFEPFELESVMGELATNLQEVQ